jgi:hypothetical protein
VYIEYYYVGIGGYCGMSSPIELPDNNFIAIRSLGSNTTTRAGDGATSGDGTTSGGGWGNILYAEFQDGQDGNVDFASPAHFEMFNLDEDAWSLKNVYNRTPSATREALHDKVHQWLTCKGDTCP